MTGGNYSGDAPNELNIKTSCARYGYMHGSITRANYNRGIFYIYCIICVRDAARERERNIYCIVLYIVYWEEIYITHVFIIF